MVNVRRSYLVCATPRSGSSLLCDFLAGTGVAGRPEEYFWRVFEPEWSARWQVAGYPDYVFAALERTATPNGMFGAKIMWQHLPYLVERLYAVPEWREGGAHALLPAVFPNLSFVWVRRLNTVRQAISLLRALQTGIWNDRGTAPQAPGEPSYHFGAIELLSHTLTAHNHGWERWFAERGIHPCIVNYERLVEDPVHVTRAVVEAIGADLPDGHVPVPRLRRQADDLSEEWYRRYWQDVGSHARIELNGDSESPGHVALAFMHGELG
jgi:LPS sulfotransferase NodH